MGGSAAGARLAIGALGPRLTRPLVVADGYALPGWAGPSTLVLARATRATPRRRCRPMTTPPRAGRRGWSPRPAARWPRARGRDGVPVIPIPGGFQPRAAIGYSLVVLWRRRPGRRGAVGASRDRGRGGAGDELAAEWGPDAPEDCEAKSIARALHGTVPVIAGAELAAAAAYRWKCQFNENAALPAFASACRRPTTTRSWAGTRRASSAGSPTCPWRTRARTRATRCAPS